MPHHRLIPLTTLLAAGALAGCTAASGGTLDAQTGTPSPTCKIHQTQEPAARYTTGTHADTHAILEMMRYYTANGTRAFCDGKPPTRTDLHWTNLYTRLGGERSRVSPQATHEP